MEKNRISILLVEDDDAFRSGLEEFLTISGNSVTALGSGVECLNTLSKKEFDIAIIDLGLPDFSGHQLVEYISQTRRTFVIVLTAANIIDERIKSYDSGANIFMGKPVNTRELMAIINNQAAHTKGSITKPYSKLVAPETNWRLDPLRTSVKTPEHGTIVLTMREYELFDILFQNSGVPISREDLCIAIYNRIDDSAYASLTTLVKRLRKKIELSGIDGTVIITAHGIGYKFAPPL